MTPEQTTRWFALATTGIMGVAVFIYAVTHVSNNVAMALIGATVGGWNAYVIDEMRKLWRTRHGNRN